MKVCAALRTGVLRIRDHEITRTPHVEIPEVVQPPLELFISVSLVRATRTDLPLVGATGRDDLWRWQVSNCRNAFGGIGSICTRTEHGFVLSVQMLGPELYDKCPSGAIPKPGKDAIVSLKAGQLAWIETRNRQCTETRGESILVDLDCATRTTVERTQFLTDRQRECLSTGCVNSKLR